jgi:hypothetical protein
MWFKLTLESANKKTGPIPTVIVSDDTCPPVCPLKDTDCYARFGPIAIQWKRVSKGKQADSNWGGFLNRIRKFSTGQLWRWAVAGDLPGKGNNIDRRKAKELAKASAHTRMFCYTHKPMTAKNVETVKILNDSPGITVNLSADSREEADELYSLGIAPVAVTLPMNAPRFGNTTPGGLPIVICPAQTNENVSCSTCKLCQVKTRKSIVGFLAHGTTAKRLSAKLEKT